MAECGAGLDDALSSFVFNYLEESENSVSCEEPLSLDFSEIDLSQLDAGDLDSSCYFDEWCSERSAESQSSSYCTDESELFHIIDRENEALLAALTQTLDDIQDDDLGLSAFQTTCDEGFLAPPAFSPNAASYAAVAVSPPPSEADEDELSILKKLLLLPALTNPSSEGLKDGNSRRSEGLKSRPQRPCLKVESFQSRKAAFSQKQGRSCSELHKHLVSPQHIPNPAPEESRAASPHLSLDSDIESDCGDFLGSDSETMTPLADTKSRPASPCQVVSQFTCDKERQSVVGLIQYMHTYCLPSRKLNAQEAQSKPAQSNLLLKKSRVHTPSEKPVFQPIKNPVVHAAASKTPLKKLCSENSILRNLLSQDLASDVSKPYRLVKPAYALPPSSSRCESPTNQLGGPKCCSLKGQERPPEKAALKLDLKPCILAQYDVTSAGQDTRWLTQATQERMSVKVSPKADSGIYAVRRSGRLNPELGPWLSFTEEDLSEALGDVHSRLSQSPESVSMEDDHLGDAEPLLQPHRMNRDSCSPLSSPESGSTFTKKAFDQGLALALCGTAGLTPPTTPPYKPTDDDLFKPDIDCENGNGVAPKEPSPTSRITEISSALSGKASKKQPERSELFAHLSRASGRSCWTDNQGTKRPLSRSFGDHDYCQVLRPEAWPQRKVLKSWEPLNQLEGRHQLDKSSEPKHGLGGQNTSGGKPEVPNMEDGNQLRDIEIRASLTKHFGFLDTALEDVGNTPCQSPVDDTVFEDSGSDSVGSPSENLRHCASFQHKQCSQRSPPSRTAILHRTRSLPGSRASCWRPRSPASRRNIRCENSEQGRNQNHWQVQRCRQRAVDEGRMVYIRNLSSSMTSSELKKRFEAFGEITECRVLSRNNKGDKYGFITYQCSENAALSLKNGASLRKRHEPAFQLSYGGLRQFWTRYTDLDSNVEEPSPSAVKSKYETMDFDSLLKEAQRSLQR